MVDVSGNTATYTMSGDGPPLETSHHGKRIALKVGEPQTHPIRPLPTEGVGKRPSQPPGREPAPRLERRNRSARATRAMPDLKSCVGAREDAGEALTETKGNTGVSRTPKLEID